MSGEIIACASCGALNRVPAERLTEGPKCGKCHKPLFAGAPVEANAVLFDKLVGKGSLPVLVDFWAGWCGPCRMMAPAFAAAARELEPQVRLAKLDTEAETAIAQRYGIRSIPLLILFRGGREIARQAGAMNQQQIVAWTRAALAGR